MPRNTGIRLLPLAARASAIAFAGMLVACADDGTAAGSAGDAGDAGVSAAEAGLEAGFLDAASPVPDSTTPPLAGVRFANWSPDAPSVDFCLAPHGTADYRGPLVRAKLEAIEDSGVLDDAGLPGLAFPQVAAYVFVPVGRYDVRVVAAGAPDCTVGVMAPDATDLPPFRARTMTTVATVGDVDPLASAPPVRVTSFQDDLEAQLDSGVPIVPLRFINAMPSVAKASFGRGTIAGATFLQWFVDVPFGQAGTLQEALTVESGGPPTAEVDDNGYALVASLSHETLSVHAFQTRTDLAVATGVDVPPGVVVTVVALGGSPAAILMCFDNAGSAGLLATCNVLAP
jgi:hypothetical protein